MGAVHLASSSSCNLFGAAPAKGVCQRMFGLRLSICCLWA
jgi:hypothetical protein